MDYSEYKDLKKRAFLEGLSGTLTTGLSAITGIADTLLSKSLLLAIAASAGTGTAAGWLVSKATAHDDRDVENARKAFTNERLRSELGYLSEQTRQEFAAQQRRADAGAARSARILNG